MSKSYNLEFTRSAYKELEKINDPFYSNIKEAILNLIDNPRPFGYIELKSRNGFRIRVGNYRIIYDIFDDQLIIEIITIGHRKDVYN